MTLHDWQAELAEIMPQVIEHRRALHRCPELSGCEEKTRGRVIGALEALGVEIRTFRDCCGVMGELKSGEGRCVAIRADMDALPIQEQTGLPFASQVPGVMHACGHDAHTALALGSAMWLSRNRDRWRGTVRWLFEPAEETFGGARLMAEQGCMEGVDVVIGQHMNPRYPAGTFFAKPGYVSGSSNPLELTILGRSCHGAYPEAGVDAIVIAAQVISALQTLISRSISPFDPAALTLGTVSGGTAGNIVCDEVKLTGTLRTLAPETCEKLKARIREVAEGVSRAMGGDARVSIRQGYGAVYNDEAAYAVVEGLARELLGEERIVRREAASLGVESFCYFTDHAPGVYYDIGSGVGAALHTPTFQVDEDCLLPGVALQCEAAMALLSSCQA